MITEYSRGELRSICAAVRLIAQRPVARRARPSGPTWLIARPAEKSSSNGMKSAAARTPE
jgi:hypothetical protein